ncbi:MAG: 8-oxo-dGTP diphosphatase MutT [Agarilytica sp.]
MDIVRVAVGVIINPQYQVCIALRPKGKHLAGYWEFPGGKIEQEESVGDALKRELFEELAIDVKSSEPFTDIHFEYPEKKVCLHVHLVREFGGEAKGQEFQEVRWVEISQLAEYQFPEANLTILKALAEWRNGLTTPELLSQ